MRPLERIQDLVDDFTPWDGPADGPTGGDPLDWPGYCDLLAQARRAGAATESVITGAAMAAGRSPRVPVTVIASVFDFIGGSMGVAAGERVVRAYERATDERLAVLVVARSGGARLQEGMAALIQLARVADAARRHADAGLVQVAYLQSPTTGGVYASYASLADVIWAAPGAIIGFAGPRVVEMTTGDPLGPNAHTAESACAAGLVDAVLEPHEVRDQLALLAGITRAGDATSRDADLSPSAPSVPSAPHQPGAVDPWTALGRARDPQRASSHRWLDVLIPRASVLVGDRAGGVDPYVRTGVGFTEAGTAVGFVAVDRSTSSPGASNPGRIGPAGYRTARRTIELAARIGLPLVTLVDTPGADPSEAAERAGVAGEIARTLAAISAHPAPTVSVIVGEGGSGGALAFSATDRCFALDGAVFEVIAPEGAAAILERSAADAPELAARLGITGADLLRLGVVDQVIAASDPTRAADRDAVRGAVDDAIATARVGDGRDRLDSATRRWLHPQS